MRFSSIIQLGLRSAWTILLRKKEPLIGSIILTDRCNLSCRHCAVNNINGRIYPYDQIKLEMQSLYRQGVRILIFYGGEPCLWKDEGRRVRDLVIEAKEMGFLLVNVITNGTLSFDIPESDLILVSIDGARENHNHLRGDTYDAILKNVKEARASNICMYMAINRMNQGDIESVCRLAEGIKNVKSVSFNFHTPYPGTEYLKLTVEEKTECCNRIEKLMDEGYPILNLRTAFPYIIHNNYQTPCYQCVVVEDGKQWVCGRCIDIEGLCDECGFFFPAEYSLIFDGNLKAIVEMGHSYLKHI